MRRGIVLVVGANIRMFSVPETGLLLITMLRAALKTLQRALAIRFLGMTLWSGKPVLEEVELWVSQNQVRDHL